MTRFLAGLLLLLLAVSAAVLSAGENDNCGVKIWPQLTDGIYNHAGILTMNCVIAADGLTVSDLAWENYQIPGFAKRWNVNMGPHREGPLTNYPFPASLSGLPLCITVEFFNPHVPWEVKETYQEIIRLGGKQRIDLPEWFHFPVKRLGYDFDEGLWFPSGWTLPAGKFALWQGAAKARQKDRNGHNPMLDFGFTHISPIAFTQNGASVPRHKRAHLFTDNEWIVNYNTEGSNPKNWMIGPFLRHAAENAVIIADFEIPNSYTWKDYQYQAFAEMIWQVREKYPDVLVGCWGVGTVPWSFRIFDHNASGVVNLAGAAQWKQHYDHPGANVHPVMTRCHLNFGNPSVYWINNSKPSQLYAFLQEWEEAKLARPSQPNVLSTWIQVETVDGYPLSQYRFPNPAGDAQIDFLKPQVPASSTYALSLFGHCVMDGLQCWEIGTRYSEDVAEYRNTQANPTAMARLEINDIEVPVYYYVKYFGFYNFHVLGMWQASVNKDIIMADTLWVMPELWSTPNLVWRTGDERYPSYANYYHEPLVRAKLSADGKTLLVIAANPYNIDLQTVKIRLPGTAAEYEFELAVDFPVIKRFPVH
ncbi:MAG: hypothetical protein WCT05_06770 [Lentisphaeria bacterium]